MNNLGDFLEKRLNLHLQKKEKQGAVRFNKLLGLHKEKRKNTVRRHKNEKFQQSTWLKMEGNGDDKLEPFLTIFQHDKCVGALSLRTGNPKKMDIMAFKNRVAFFRVHNGQMTLRTY